MDGWVSLEVSPLLAHDTARTVADARALHAKANRPNLFIKIPGTLEGLPAIEEAIFSGIPVNVTLLFSRDHYLAAAHISLTVTNKGHTSDKKLRNKVEEAINEMVKKGGMEMTAETWVRKAC